MKPLALGLLALTALGQAQAPDVKIKVDFRAMYRSVRGEDSALKFFDWQARHSLATLELRLEPGYRAVVSERFQKIRGDADDEQLDVYYLEDPDIWRVGKQPIPFGLNRLLNEKARGASADTNILFGSNQIAGAFFDNGQNRVRGAALRVGRDFGVSFAIGNFLGAQSSSLTPIRKPEDSLGLARGYRLAIGSHLRKQTKGGSIEIELLALRRGDTALDQDADITDVLVSLTPDRNRSVSVAWARDWRTTANYIRLLGRFSVHRNAAVEPFVRLRNGQVFDASVVLNLRF